MGVTTTQTNKPFNPRGNDQSPKGYNRAKLYSGKALDFDGVNDYVEVSDNASLDFTTAMSAFCYARVDSVSQSNNTFFAKYDYGNDNRSWILLQTNDVFRVIISKNGQTSGTNIKDYQFSTFENTSDYYFIGFTFESNVLKLYVNGQEVEPNKVSDSEVNAIHSGTAKASVGCNFSIGTPQAFFNGKVANARAFNTALTAAQVADLYNNPEKVVPTGVDNTALKLWLPMMEGAGTTAYDGSGNGNHGTISGATYVNGIGAPSPQSAVMDWNKGSNYFLQSNTFSTSWTAYAVSVVSGQSGYAGTNNAWKLQSTGASASYIEQISAINSLQTISIIAKSGNANFLVISNQGGGFSWYNLSNGTLGSSGGTIQNKSITSLDDGWYLCTLTNTANITGVNFHIADADGSTTATNGNYIYIQNSQRELTSTAGPYVPTLATAQTSEVLLPQGLTTGRDITGVNLFENVRKQGALNLDGNSWAEVHDNASLDVTTGLSIENWIYIEDAATQGRILSKWGSSQPNRSFQMFMNNAVVRFLIGDGSSQASLNSSTSLTEGNWHHIVSTYDGANIKIYINGSADATTTETFTIYNSNEPVLIGGYIGGTILSVNPIAQPRIYNRALTAEEVQRNYNAGKNTYTN